jgi:hypothetical protein
MAVYGPVHILPYDLQCHELFAIYTHVYTDFLGQYFQTKCQPLYLLMLICNEIRKKCTNESDSC